MERDLDWTLTVLGHRSPSLLFSCQTRWTPTLSEWRNRLPDIADGVMLAAEAERKAGVQEHRTRGHNGEA
jgi:hypothetical protein